MYPTSLDDFGLEEAVRNGIVAVCEGHGLDVTFSTAGFQDRLPPHLELTLFRIAQEAVTNVVKHADATQVTITLERTGDFAVLSVSDDGRGFDPSEAHAPGHLGLAGMRERAKLVGGTVGVEASRGLGVNIVATIPVPRTRSEGAE
jgi:signal transduction histidine kinase